MAYAPNTNDYYPYGMQMPGADGEMQRVQPYKFGGKEHLSAGGLNIHDFGPRALYAPAGQFASADPKCEDYPHLSPYLYCAANPVNAIDPTGMAWKPINDVNGEYTGFEWIPDEESYDEDGNLLDGLYEQAIFFTEGGVKGYYDPEKGTNMGTSTAYVYDKNGEVECFDACTYPSDIKKYATVPGKLLEAQVGIHNVNSTDENRKYPALRMSEIGTENFYGNYIDLGEPNPSNPSTNLAWGINIHKPLSDNGTGIFNKSSPASMGCFLIDINNWNRSFPFLKKV